jgi:hypothetical protein
MGFGVSETETVGGRRTGVGRRELRIAMAAAGAAGGGPDGRDMRRLR